MATPILPAPQDFHLRPPPIPHQPQLHNYLLSCASIHNFCLNIIYSKANMIYMFKKNIQDLLFVYIYQKMYERIIF